MFAAKFNARKTKIVEIPRVLHYLWKIFKLKLSLVFGLILIPSWLKFEFKNQFKIALEASWRPDLASWRPDWAVLSGSRVITACF